MLQLTLKDSTNTTQITVQVTDQTLADAWIGNAASGIWGKPDRWVNSSADDKGIVSVPGEDITKSDQNRIVTLVAAIPAVNAVLDNDGNVVTPAQLAVPAVTETQYHFLAEYTITQMDISAQVAQQAAVSEALAYLQSTDWYVVRQLDNGVAMPSDVKTKREQARLVINPNSNLTS